MTLRETFAFAYVSLRRSGLRSALTALGIVIGVASVVAMSTIGRGTAARIGEEIRKLGTQLITVRVGQDVRAGSGTSADAKPFDYDDVEALRAQIRSLRVVAPVSEQKIRVSARRANWLATVTGTESEYLEARRWRLQAGRTFTGHEVYAGKNVCIIGATVREKLFNGADPIGEILRIKSLPCEIVGILAPRGQSGLAYDEDNTVLTPLYGFQRRIQGTPNIQSIVILAHPDADTTRAKARIEGLLRERRGIAAGQSDNFHVLEMRQIAEAAAGTTRTLTALLAAIAAVSLLVGGIGIMNIMLVAVSERTVEIGVRLAIGALPRQVMTQFLAEAVLLSVIGGTIGIFAGLAAAALSQRWVPVPFIIDPQIIALAFFTSVAVGILFGYAPAARAARLDPARALRSQ
jgi:putative ABC transport system permease protein